MIAIAAAIGLAIGWVWLARRSLLYLLPAYIVAVAVDFPGAPTVLAYPDLGFGFLADSLVKVGDVLLVITVLLTTKVRAQVRGPLILALIALAGIALAAHWTDAQYPTLSVLFYAQAPVRLALLIALFRAADPLGDPERLRLAILGTLGLFAIPVALLLVGYAVPAVNGFAETVGMRSADGRIAFAGLGNNKIGLCLILLAAVAILAWLSGPPDRFRLSPLFVATLAAAIAGMAQLRFATTVLAVLVLLAALRRGPAHAAAGLFASAAALLAIASGALGGVGARSLSVVSGDFQLATDSSFLSRQRLWGAAVDLWQESPWVGRLGSWEWDRAVPSGALRAPIETHNEYLWWLASFGLVGAVVLVAVLAPVLRAISRGLLPGVAVIGVLVGLSLNAASYFPAAAAILAFLSVVAAELHRSPGSVAPGRAVRPQGLVQRRVVDHRAVSGRGR